MGWASATEIVIDTWKIVRKFIPDDKKVDVLKDFIIPFMKSDWDTEDEIIDEFPEAEKAIQYALCELLPKAYECPQGDI